MPRIFKVGGCIRDAFLGVNSKDIDFTFVLDDLDITVDEGFTIMTQWLNDNGFDIFLSTPDCFTIRAKFPTHHSYSGLTADFVMARKEVGYIKDTRQPILELGTLYDDLLRRDFTVNAIAEDEDGNIIDPFGGILHIRERLLYTPQLAKKTMMDDPLRILRALRFSITKNFSISEDIKDAMKQDDIIRKLNDVVSSERIMEEVYKMFKHDTIKAIGILTYVDNEIMPGFMSLVFKDGLWLKPTFKLK